MKKIIAFMLCSALLLSACGGTSGSSSTASESTSSAVSEDSSTAESTESTSEDASESTSEDDTQIANPMVEYESAVFPGYELVNYPNNDDLAPEKYWLIDGELIQLDYTVELQEIKFRAQKGEGLDISGVYDTFEEDVTQDFTRTDGGVVTVRSQATAAGAALCTWTYNGWSYSLYMPHSPMGMIGGLLPQFLEADGVTTETTAQ